MSSKSTAGVFISEAQPYDYGSLPSGSSRTLASEDRRAEQAERRRQARAQARKKAGR